MKFIMLINVKIVGILTVISMLNITSEGSKARNLIIFQNFGYYEPLKFHAHSSFITLGPVVML